MRTDADLPCLIRPGHEPTGFAAASTLIMVESQGHALRSIVGDALPCGSVVELGYFSEATIHQLFAGAWTPLIGLEAPVRNRAIAPIFAGNGGEAPGMVTWCRTFFAGVDALPPVGRPLALRFFDHPSRVDAFFYNTVSHPAWWFREPRSPSPTFVMMSLDEAALRWESGPTGSFRTVLRNRKQRRARSGGWRRAWSVFSGAR